MRNGNFGYKDEKTGADWRVARTNLEDSVYLQHWHQNDPGVIPNLHQTLAGSPTGILIYEGNALPEKYNGRLFLADAGTNELNSYEISPNGAGYQLKKFNVLDASQADKWFRPSDICVAPDGSLFVADWYDSGVGGHFIGDLDRGRIYKLSKTNHVTNLPKFDFTNPVSAVEALKSPNMATRYLAHKAILKNKSQAEAPLYNLWKNENPVLSVRALWLLADINKKYVEEGSKHLNPNIRATAVRIASQHKNTSEDFYVKMAQDPSITVREAVATDVYKKNFPKAWITLAQKYTSYDKWNLEALGIAAEGNWDSYLGKYLKELKGGWLKNPAALDIIWRSRALQTPQLLAEIIQNVTFEESKRYFRAFDFQNREASNSSLVELLKTNLKEETILLVFKHFDANTIKSNKDFQTILPQVLAKIKDDKDFLEIARKYELSEQKSRITKILNESQDKAIITEAANILTLFFGVAPFNEVLSKKPYSEEYIIKNIERIGLVDNEVVAKQLIQIFSNKKYSFKIREAAVLAMEGYQSDFKLWNLIKVNKLSKELLPAAKKVLSKTYRSDLKTEFEAKYGKPTEQIAVISNQLLQQKGNKTKGKEIFEMYCTTCHVAEGIGNEFGPGLGQIGKKLTKESIYNAIIQPSQGISFGYEGHNITLEDGSTIQAIITSKTQEAYILKFPGQSNIVTYKKSQVKSVSEMTTSMMPAFNLPETEMVDLLEYLSQLK
jgi:putative heme-binding domain-containing protein